MIFRSGGEARVGGKKHLEDETRLGEEDVSEGFGGVFVSVTSKGEMRAEGKIKTA